jgi:hypothetical protein
MLTPGTTHFAKVLHEMMSSVFDLAESYAIFFNHIHPLDAIGIKSPTN